MLTSQEVAEYYSDLGKKKANYPISKIILLAIMGGIMIALASAGSNTVSATTESPSLAKFLSGLIFPAGLAMVVLTGAELYSSSCLVILSRYTGKVDYSKLLTYWFFVFIGNIVGSFIIALLIYSSGQLSFFDNQVALITIKTGIKKVSHGFTGNVSLGILCNILVCLSTLMAAAGKSACDKIAGLFFPIMLFILCGFEHCVANMYYVPAAILALQNPVYRDLALEHGMHIENLSVASFFLNNLLPVTLGNMIGGALMISGVYYFLYLRKH